MKLLHSLVITALLVGSAGIASADTVILNSYGSNTGTTVPAGSTNSATFYTGTAALPPDSTTPAGTSYDIGVGNAWIGPVGTSSWVSLNADDCPGCGHVETDGSYDYSTSFTINGTVTGGTLSVLADDTTSVYLNGVQLIPAATATESTSGKCTAGEPNCTEVDTFTLPTTGYIQGTNILSFGVQQDFQGGTGVDFSGSISTTPEPNTLVLLGTGLVAAAGLARRRFNV